MRIFREGNLITLINVFETKPEQQQELINQWIRLAVDSYTAQYLNGRWIHS